MPNAIDTSIEQSKRKVAELDQAKRRSKRTRIVAFIFGVALLASAVVFVVLSRKEGYIHIPDYVNYAIGTLGIFIIVAASLISDGEQKLDRARAISSYEAYSAVKEMSASAQYVDLLGSVSLGQINQYYQFVVTNVQRSSRVSTFMLLGGFTLLAFAIGVGLFNKDLVSLSYVSGISGILLEFFGCGVLALNRTNVLQFNEYMDRLDAFSQTLLALTLIDHETDEIQKKKMRAIWFTDLVSVVARPDSGPSVSKASNRRSAK